MALLTQATADPYPPLHLAYQHSRMRARVESLLKILNRARPEVQVERTKTSRYGHLTFLMQPRHLSRTAAANARLRARGRLVGAPHAHSGKTFKKF